MICASLSVNNSCHDLESGNLMFNPNAPGKKLLAIIFLAIIVAAAAGFYFLSRGETTAQMYSISNRWTWAGTTQSSRDGLEVTMFSRTEEITGEQTKRGYGCWVVKSGDAGSPENYSLDYLRVEEGGMYKVAGESFSGGSKTGETVYAGPALMIEFPLEAEKKWTDTKSLSGYDEVSGIELMSMQKTSSNEVLRRESVTVQAGTFECWVIESTEILDGTYMITVENQLLGAQATIVSTQTGWYSESVKNFVKLTVETTTIMTILDQQQPLLETSTEMNLSSYSI